jgi:hypothetical protein
MSDATFYSAIAWALTGDATHADNAVHFVDTWFLNSDTAMNPNLNYAQMARGPNGQVDNDASFVHVVDPLGFLPFPSRFSRFYPFLPLFLPLPTIYSAELDMQIAV